MIFQIATNKLIEIDQQRHVL